MTSVPAPTLYQRWLGWHAPAMRRALTAFTAGLIVAAVLLPFVTWGLALVAGWDTAALTILEAIWPIIVRADSSRAPKLAGREDETEGSARPLLVGASVASLLGAGYALHLAGRESGAPRVLLIGFAVLTVVLSWAVINTVYTLRYADQHFRSKPEGHINMRISIIGTGKVGSALAHVFARNHLEACAANTRGPESFPELAAEVGPTVRAVALDEALGYDLIILAVPFLAVEPLGRSRPDWRGKTIVDVTNAFMLPNADELLAGRLSTEIVAEAFPGAETVKAFNQLPANVLGRDRSAEEGKQVIFVSSNSENASTRVAQLAERLGYSAIELGRIDEGGRLIQARNALTLRNLIELPLS